MKLLNFPKKTLNTTTRLFNDLINLPEFIPLTNMDDLVICNLDSESLHPLYNDVHFYDEHFGINKFKVFVIHELDKGSIPFLKCADLLIFFTKNQQRNFKKVIKINIPSVVIPYPIDIFEPKPKNNSMVFLSDFNLEHVKDYIQFLKTWGKKSQKASFKIYDLDNNKITSLKNTSVQLLPEKLIALFIVKKEDVERYEKFKFDFKCYACDNFETIEIIESDSYFNVNLDSILEMSEYSYIFNKELSQNKFDKLAKYEDIRLIYTNFTDNFLLTKCISHKCKIIIADGVSTWEKTNRPSQSEFIITLTNCIYKFKHTRSNAISRMLDDLPMDNPSDINIIFESPNARMANYFFIVNFRNQADKITRCLNSINYHCTRLNATIIVTDDCSTDNSKDVVINHIKTEFHMVKFIFISNIDRKYASRNLFNSVSNFIDNQNAIIIEVDGDDYLNAQYPVMYLLDTQYENGMLTTHGQLVAQPSDFQGMEKYNNVFDINNQWHQNKCAAWLPLRTYRKHLFDKVDLIYFVDMENGQWLKNAHDASIHSRMIELSEGKTGLIKHPIYIYDCSGFDHDAIVEEWSPLPSYRKLYHVITY